MVLYMEDLWELKLTFRWNTPGTLPSLAVLDVADNNLTGALPTAWGTSQSVLLTQGEVHAARTGQFGCRALGFTV